MATKFIEVKVASGRLVFALGNGTRIEFDPARVSDDIRKQAMFHGFNQKIKDAAAGFSKANDFAGAAKAMGAVIDALHDNSWNRKGGGERGVDLEDLATAISRVRNVDFEKAYSAVSKAEPTARKAWAANARVAQIMAELRLERAKAAAESATDDGLPEFEDETEAGGDETAD